MTLEFWKKKKKSYESALEMHNNDDFKGADKLIMDKGYLEKQLATINKIIEKMENKLRNLVEGGKL